MAARRKPSSNGSRRPNGEQTRSRLLDAARELANEMTFNRVTVQDVTSRAGTSRATFYLYFDNIDEIYLELGRETCEELFRVTTESWTLDDPRTAIHGWAHGYVATFRKHSGVLRVCYARRFDDEAFSALVVDTRRRLSTQLQAHLEAGIALGVVRPMEPRLAGEALNSMMEAVCVHELDDQRHAQLELVAETLGELCFHALASRAALAASETPLVDHA
jgi:AcrR family transcriptional regulator